MIHSFYENRRLIQRWSEYLPPDIVKQMTDPRLVSVMDGDILRPDVGLGPDDLDLLHRRANIIIHTASSIALLSRLEKLVDPIINATERLAHIALKCDQLECFAYVSSAYANGHLFSQTDGTSGVEIQESLYPLYGSANGNDIDESLQQELSNVRKTGSSSAFQSHDFPWAYAYAKHLTERLLTRAFASSNKNLLIIRPSIIEPAQYFPYRQFCHPMSAPHVIVAAAVALVPSRTICLSSRFSNPEKDSSVDCVPVDVVVDRLLIHVAHGTNGAVHAVAGPARMSLEDSWSRSFKHRRIPWPLRLSWTLESWHSVAVHPIARVYRIFGTSFEFREEKTAALWRQLPDSERSALHLFVDKDILYHDHEHIREDHVRVCMAYLTRQRTLTRWLARLVYYPLAATFSHETDRYTKFLSLF